MAEPTVTKLFDEREIATRAQELARAVADRVPGDFVIVGLLIGSFVFIADLVRELHRLGRDPKVEFMRLSSYGPGRKSSGEVRLISEPCLDLYGCTVLLVDDIVDTGRTILFARDLLRERGASCILTCALVDKPSRREVAVDLDYVGFTVPDVFIVGYGIDYGHEYRNLPFIGMID